MTALPSPMRPPTGLLLCSRCLLLVTALCIGVPQAVAQPGRQESNTTDPTNRFEPVNGVGSIDSILNDSGSGRRLASGHQWRSFFGIDGSKQPQDFGANANLGVLGQWELSGPLSARHGIGYQVGTSLSFSGNAVQVFELLGESKDRFQNFTTVGVFRRWSNGIGIGAGYDWMYQDSYDKFRLGQWRLQAEWEWTDRTTVGLAAQLAGDSDQGQFGAIPVTLAPVEQLQWFVQQRWQAGAITKAWIGVADEHNEDNVVTGTLPPKSNQILFGAELFAPLNDCLAIYGETNLVMPADTGAVDAFLGLEYAPGGAAARRSTGNRYRPLLATAASTRFTTDLKRR